MTGAAAPPAHVLAEVRRVQGVVFDCDGVLFDSRDVNRAYYNFILERLGLPPMSPEAEEYAYMHTVDAVLAYLVPAHLLPQAKALQGHMTYGDFLDRMIPAPGVHDVLEALHGWGIRLAVNTNRKNSMEMVLERFGMAHLFAPVMTAAKVTRPKPDPEGLYRILAYWDMAPEQVAYVGDSEVDAATAAAAGVPLWAYRNPELPAKLHVDSFADLRHWFAYVLGGAPGASR
ncbi:MAG: Haloacid dehalogenase domain protein hydrolase [Desulfomicrobiaceae bacterium]|jgi:phosphoglycolate phosphatase-like HAD superfamily hydrolase|nr:Haloacid dehalogenase domain protein hydrolase [Desulfomicrobiaceae bacterium]MDI3492133.1 phosphoglycolate phosphatase [Desulfomicrobiaceae bacterium]MDK2872478.1 phosphoglycolate phosphatase [Desulfomicrobiaceae bacterium]HCF05895.1 HAD family hydrolase [Desulfomicrobiaceae bacterium]